MTNGKTVRSSVSDLRSMTLAERLQAINFLLIERNLRVFPSLGDNTKGWPEIQDILGWEEDSAAPYLDITFEVRRTTGDHYNHTIRFNRNGRFSDGVAFIPEINGLVALTRQYRVSVGQETWELARGFAELIDSQSVLGPNSLPPALVRELGEEVIRDAKVISVTPLGSFAENTGTHNSWVDAYIVQVSANSTTLQSLLGGTQNLGAKLVTWDELSHPSHLGIRDAHSLALISLAREKKIGEAK